MEIKGIYDNGGNTFDRYTVVLKQKLGNHNWCLVLSHNPHEIQGFSSFAKCMDGDPLLGSKINFEDLPENIQKHIKRRIE